MAAKAKPTATRTETQWAQALIKAMGSTQSNDPYLVQAIVAWFRSEGGIKNMRGNNPLQIRASQFAIGRVTSANGKFKMAKFSSMKAAVQAYAWYMSKGQTSYGIDGGNPKEMWGKVIGLVRRKVNSEKERNQRANDLMQRIAEAGWNGGTYFNHYGFNPQSNRSKLTEQYLKMGGMWVPTPKPVVQKVVKVTKFAAEPRSLSPNLDRREYMDPYAINAFYNGRKHIYAYLMTGLDPAEQVG